MFPLWSRKRQFLNKYMLLRSIWSETDETPGAYRKTPQIHTLLFLAWLAIQMFLLGKLDNRLKTCHCVMLSLWYHSHYQCPISSEHEKGLLHFDYCFFFAFAVMFLFGCCVFCFAVLCLNSLWFWLAFWFAVTFLLSFGFCCHVF